MTKLLYFAADWCAPCKQMKPILEEFSSENPDILVVKIDVDEDFEAAAAMKISSVPTFVVIKNDEEVARKPGAFSKQKLEQLVFGDNNG